MILKGNEDLRVRRTIESIKESFSSLIVEKDYDKITCLTSYHSVREEMMTSVNRSAWSTSEAYRKLSDYEKKILMNFINYSVLEIYRTWVSKGKVQPLEDVIALTNRIVLHGVEGFFNDR